MTIEKMEPTVPKMRAVRGFALASFRHDQEHSVTYHKFKTLQTLRRHLEWVVLSTDADYVSLRIIRKGD